MCDVWIIRNPKTKRYTFRQKHISGLFQRRLDYFYVSNSMQVSVKNKIGKTSCNLKIGKTSCNSKVKINSVIIKQDEITGQAEINKQIFSFYQSFLSRKVQNQADKIEAYLEHIPLPKLTNEQTLSCKSLVPEDEVFKSLKL